MHQGRKQPACVTRSSKVAEKSTAPAKDSKLNALSKIMNSKNPKTKAAMKPKADTSAKVTKKRPTKASARRKTIKKTPKKTPSKKAPSKDISTLASWIEIGEKIEDAGLCPTTKDTGKKTARGKAATINATGKKTAGKKSSARDDPPIWLQPTGRSNSSDLDSEEEGSQILNCPCCQKRIILSFKGSKGSATAV